LIYKVPNLGNVLLKKIEKKHFVIIDSIIVNLSGFNTRRLCQTAKKITQITPIKDKNRGKIACKNTPK